MAVCSCTCKLCTKRIDRYSGYLLNISDKAMSLLRGKVDSEKHYVLCSDCIENLIGPIIDLTLLKFNKVRGMNEWYTSNLLWFYKRQIGLSVVSNNERVEFTENMYEILKSLIIENDHKGILKGVYLSNVVHFSGLVYDITSYLQRLKH